MSVAPIAPIAAVDPGLPAARTEPFGVAAAGGRSFGDMLLDGIAATDKKLVEADRIAKAFVLDDSIPVHQVTYALEEARLSLELMLQVRDRLLDGYRRFMDMQV